MIENEEEGMIHFKSIQLPIHSISFQFLFFVSDFLHPESITTISSSDLWENEEGDELKLDSNEQMCHCNDCIDSENTCLTDGYCFAQIDEVSDAQTSNSEYKVTYGCFDSDNIGMLEVIYVIIVSIITESILIY